MEAISKTYFKVETTTQLYELERVVFMTTKEA